MQVIQIDPKKCVRWKFADRSGFEFGDIHALSQDILKNGQIEPAILRKVKGADDQYEVIAGSRRWKACLEAGIPLKGIVQDLSDEQAAVAQIKENQKLPLSDYSKGIYYAKLLREKKMTVGKLAASIGCSRPKLQNFLTFEKVPQAIWDAVGNLSRVSSRTASTILALSQKGENYISALINLAEDIRKGIGSRTLEKKVLNTIKETGNYRALSNDIRLPSGLTVAKWTKDGLQFAKDVSIDRKAFETMVIRHFEKTLKETKSDAR